MTNFINIINTLALILVFIITKCPKYLNQMSAKKFKLMTSIKYESYNLTINNS